ncbi:hypothetical protein CEXT_243291 [Caerostris extrusa]|uniref:Uncharacterized protein n=1 Tax=Caerostris extrusa TaxID=172846 RepID=A0AAV4XR96_CAEEX|nr:hypothetical protein CEXT_243291 [Caerostris extrusa]
MLSLVGKRVYIFTGIKRDISFPSKRRFEALCQQVFPNPFCNCVTLSNKSFAFGRRLARLEIRLRHSTAPGKTGWKKVSLYTCKDVGTFSYIAAGSYFYWISKVDRDKNNRMSFRIGSLEDVDLSMRWSSHFLPR